MLGAGFLRSKFKRHWLFLLKVLNSLWSKWRHTGTYHSVSFPLHFANGTSQYWCWAHHRPYLIDLFPSPVSRNWFSCLFVKFKKAYAHTNCNRFFPRPPLNRKCQGPGMPRSCFPNPGPSLALHRRFLSWRPGKCRHPRADARRVHWADRQVDRRFNRNGPRLKSMICGTGRLQGRGVACWISCIYVSETITAVCHHWRNTRNAYMLASGWFYFFFLLLLQPVCDGAR